MSNHHFGFISFIQWWLLFDWPKFYLLFSSLWLFMVRFLSSKDFQAYSWAPSWNSCSGSAISQATQSCLHFGMQARRYLNQLQTTFLHFGWITTMDQADVLVGYLRSVIQ